MDTHKPKQTRQRMKIVKPDDVAEMASGLLEAADLISTLNAVMKAAVDSGAYKGEDILVEAGGMGASAIAEVKSWLRRTTAAFTDRNTTKAKEAMKKFIAKKKKAPASKK